MVRPPKQLVEKTIHRISESKWTKLFVFTSILQAILVMTLEGRVYAHNNKLHRQYSDASDGCSPVNSTARIANIAQENLVFMGFQFFQILFCINAIYNQNTIQMISIAVINYACALFGIVQIFETVKWNKSIKDEMDGISACSQTKPPDDTTIYVFEVPLVVVLLVFGTSLGFLAFKLYQQFGWNIYKRIGADLQMQAVYRAMLIFVMLLKLDLFFMLAFSMLALFVFDYGSGKSDDGKPQLSRNAFYFHLGMTILIIPVQLLAYIALRKENSPGMILFSVFCIVSIVDYMILLKYSIGDNTQQTWYFWIFFIIVSVVLTGLTTIWSILCTKNFGRGLKAHLVKGKDINLQESDANQLANPPPRRWAIEDDDDL